MSIDWENVAVQFSQALETAHKATDDAKAAIQRVRDLHKPDEDWTHICSVCEPYGLIEWPCRTIRALDGKP